MDEVWKENIWIGTIISKSVLYFESLLKYNLPTQILKSFTFHDMIIVLIAMKKYVTFKLLNHKKPSYSIHIIDTIAALGKNQSSKCFVSHQNVLVLSE